MAEDKQQAKDFFKRDKMDDLIKEVKMTNQFLYKIYVSLKDNSKNNDRLERVVKEIKDLLKERDRK